MSNLEYNPLKVSSEVIIRHPFVPSLQNVFPFHIDVKVSSRVLGVV